MFLSHSRSYSSTPAPAPAAAPMAAPMAQPKQPGLMGADGGYCWWCRCRISRGKSLSIDGLSHLTKFDYYLTVITWRLVPCPIRIKRCQENPKIHHSNTSVLLMCDNYWCLNRHLCILPERFAKKDLNLVIVCRKDIMS